MYAHTGTLLLQCTATAQSDRRAPGRAACPRQYMSSAKLLAKYESPPPPPKYELLDRAGCWASACSTRGAAGSGWRPASGAAASQASAARACPAPCSTGSRRGLPGPAGPAARAAGASALGAAGAGAAPAAGAACAGAPRQDVARSMRWPAVAPASSAAAADDLPTGPTPAPVAAPGPKRTGPMDVVRSTRAGVEARRAGGLPGAAVRLGPGLGLGPVAHSRLRRPAGAAAAGLSARGAPAAPAGASLAGLRGPAVHACPSRLFRIRCTVLLHRYPGPRALEQRVPERSSQARLHGWAVEQSGAEHGWYLLVNAGPAGRPCAWRQAALSRSAHPAGSGAPAAPRLAAMRTTRRCCPPACPTAVHVRLRRIWQCISYPGTSLHADRTRHCETLASTESRAQRPPANRTYDKGCCRGTHARLQRALALSSHCTRCHSMCMSG